MGFFDDITRVANDVGKAIPKQVIDTAKDVGTATTRIVTDTAIDTADVATGFQFTEDLDGAKQTMTDAGVLSTADAIEKNHYACLKQMEQEATSKYDEIVRLYNDGNTVEANRDRRLAVLTDMLNDVSLLLQIHEEAKQLLAAASQIPNWQTWAQILDIPPIASLDEVSSYTTQWNAIGQRVFQSKLGIDIAAGVTGGIDVAVGLASGMKSLSSIAKLSRGSKVLGSVTKASKFLKIGKIAGRTSAVLMVASIGLDVGLTVIQLEERKAQLEQYLKELNEGIAEANQDIAAITLELQEIELRISELLNSVTPPQSEATWDRWVDSTKTMLNEFRARVVSVDGIRRTAIAIAKSSKGERLKIRIALVMESDPSISSEDAQQIITDVDHGNL